MKCQSYKWKGDKMEYSHFGPRQVQSAAVFSNIEQVYLCMFVQADTNPNLNTMLEITAVLK